MVTVSGLVDMAIRNWPWLLLFLGAFWYLRWWTEANRFFPVWSGEIGKPPDPVSTLFGAIRVEFDQNRRRTVAILSFVFGGLLVIINTVGFGLAMFTQLDPITWASITAAAFGLVGLSGIEPSPTVVGIAILVAGGTALTLRTFWRRRSRR